MTIIPSTTVADAVQRLTQIDDAYVVLPIDQGFNWSDSFGDVHAGEWYLVVFRSKHRADSDEQLLTDLDEQAQIAAQQAPGFLYYFMGTPTSQRECLSFCLWEDQRQAQAASRQQAHQTAQQVAVTMYEHYQLERYIVRKSDGIGAPTFQRL